MPPKGDVLQKYGAPLYAIEWFGEYAFMCGGGNNGIENKYVFKLKLAFSVVVLF